MKIFGSKSSRSNGGRQVFESIYGPPKGQFLQTTHGTTHYILHEAVVNHQNTSNKSLNGSSNHSSRKTPPLVVLIHGLGGHAGVFDTIAADLVAQGHAVLRYDLYDRGYSETCPTKYPIPIGGAPHPLPFTLELHIQQLHDILTQLKLIDHKNILLCGHSTGGVTAMGYADKYPDSIRGLVLISSVCLPLKVPAAAKWFKGKLGNCVCRHVGAFAFVQFSRRSMAHPDQMKDFLELQQRFARENPRFLAAVRSTNQHCKGFGGTSAEDEFRACCLSPKIPIHLIWGKDDKVIPYDHCVTLKQIALELGTAVTEESYEGMPHNVFFPDAKPKEVSKSICQFLESVL